MYYIMILWVSLQGDPGIVIDHIEFNNKEKCEAAGSAIKKDFTIKNDDGTTQEEQMGYYCVEK